MSPSRKTKEPTVRFRLDDWNGDHGIYMLVSRRTRWIVTALLLSLIFSGTGTTFSTALDIFKLFSGLEIPP